MAYSRQAIPRCCLGMGSHIQVQMECFGQASPQYLMKMNHILEHLGCSVLAILQCSRKSSSHSRGQLGPSRLAILQCSTMKIRSQQGLKECFAQESLLCWKRRANHSLARWEQSGWVIPQCWMRTMSRGQVQLEHSASASPQCWMKRTIHILEENRRSACSVSANPRCC